MTAVREHGLDCAVFMMPILPYLTDTREHLDEGLRRAKAAGATSVLYTALYLKPGVKDWFMQWLEGAHPELVERYAELYRGSAYAPTGYRNWLAARIKPLIRSHGLERGRPDPSTGGVRSSAPGRGMTGERPLGSLIAEELPVTALPAGIGAQPTLF